MEYKNNIDLIKRKRSKIILSLDKYIFKDIL